MWTKAKSATLTLICNRVLIGFIIAVAAVFPFLLMAVSYGAYPDGGLLYIGVSEQEVTIFVICVYACFVPAMIALFTLDRLLRNIRLGLVFSPESVKYLRIISWCCFVIAIVLLCGWPFLHIALIFAAAIAAFFGLLMRVVKNVIDAACEIKDENDFTI